MQMPVTDESLEEIKTHFDEDGDGGVTFDEFCMIYYPSWESMNVIRDPDVDAEDRDVIKFKDETFD